MSSNSKVDRRLVAAAVVACAAAVAMTWLVQAFVAEPCVPNVIVDTLDAIPRLSRGAPTPNTAQPGP